MIQYDFILKFAHSIGVSAYLRHNKKNRLSVLCLHRITPEIDYFWQPISPENFEKLIQYAIKNYEVILFKDLNEISKNRTKAKPLLVISFDDGYYDFIEYAMPILYKYKVLVNHNLVNQCLSRNQVIWTQQLNFIFNFLRNQSGYSSFHLNGIQYSLSMFSNNWMKFYLFIFNEMLQLNKIQRDSTLIKNQNLIGADWTVKMMTWEDAKLLVSNGIEVGCHTYSHDVLSTITNSIELNIETLKSKMELEEKLEVAIDILSLPNGKANQSDMDFFFKHYKFVLHANDEYTLLRKIGNINNDIGRVNMINEKPYLMYLRTELFYTKAKTLINGKL